jgi:hypothetical protein
VTESIEKHYYGAHADAGNAEMMAQRAADLGWIAHVHHHSYAAWYEMADVPLPCVAACRKVAPAP